MGKVIEIRDLNGNDSNSLIFAIFEEKMTLHKRTFITIKSFGVVETMRSTIFVKTINRSKEIITVDKAVFNFEKSFFDLDNSRNTIGENPNSIILEITLVRAIKKLKNPNSSTPKIRATIIIDAKLIMMDINLPVVNENIFFTTFFEENSGTINKQLENLIFSLNKFLARTLRIFKSAMQFRYQFIL